MLAFFFNLEKSKDFAKEQNGGITALLKNTEVSSYRKAPEHSVKERTTLKLWYLRGSKRGDHATFPPYRINEKAQELV